MINKRTSFAAIIIAFLMIGLLMAQLPHLEFDYELENFFPKNDPDLAYYQEFSKKFGHDNDYLLLGFESKSNLFDLDFLNKLDEGIIKVAALEATKRVVSPTTIKTIVKTPLGLLPIPLIHLDDGEKLKKDSLKLYQHELFREMLISKSNNSWKAIVLHERFESKEEADTYVANINRIFANQAIPIRIAGKAVAQTAFVNAVKDDFGKFILIAMILIFLMLLLFMRNLLMIIVSLMIAGLSVVTTIGIMALTGKEIDVLSSLIPTILLVVTMSDLIHLFDHIQTGYRKSNNLRQSISTAVKEVGLATLLTSFTTAVGFLTLITINVKPIIDLGIYVAIGIVSAFIITYLLFPTIITLTKPSFAAPLGNKKIESFLRNMFLFTIRKSKTILTSTLIVLVLGLIGLQQIEIDAYLVNDLPKNDLVKSDFLFFDQEFSGSKPFSLSLWLKDSTKKIYSKEIITQIDRIEQLTIKHTGAGDLFSPASYVKFANQSLHQGSIKYFKLPETDRDWQRAIKFIETTQPERRFAKVTVGTDMQIAGYFQDLGSKDATIKLKKLMTALNEEVNQELIGLRLTGTTLLIDKSHELLSMNLIKGLLAAMVIVGLIAGWMFKSWRMVFITLIPNLFPILIVAAIMGYFQIPLNLSTSVIFAISFGIVVDDTIHFLSRFKQVYKGKTTKLYAVKNSILSTGRPIFITTIILTIGFLVFCFSNFSASFFMGLFVSISFITALLADLFLLPVLLLWWLPNNKN